jgi:hypothetical protein
MSWTFDSLESWYAVVLAALNVLALATWVAVARYRVVVRAGRTRTRKPLPRSESAGPEPTIAAPSPVPTAGETFVPAPAARFAAPSDPARERERPAAENRGETRLREDLERWRRHAEAMRAEASA